MIGQDMPTPDFDKTIGKIADRINKKRREELMSFYSDNNEFSEYIKDARNFETFKKGNKSGSMKKVASMPQVVDQFFTKVYGENYYKDPNFFIKHAPEWGVNKWTPDV